MRGFNGTRKFRDQKRRSGAVGSGSNGMTKVVKSGSAAVERPASHDLEQFELVLTTAMEAMGLPSQGIFIPPNERLAVLRNFESAISLLDSDHRTRSMYLSKFIAAVGAGLFDAALNYLWDETISELRRRVVGYDLSYFFDIAVQSPERRKQLKDEDDLVRVDDYELIRACNEIELISDVGFRQLDLIRYMRNFASAAHPNQNEIGSMQLLGWVQTCIKEVITLPETSVVAEIKRLLKNVKSVRLDSNKASEISNFFDELPRFQADNLGAGLFGIYTELGTSSQTRDNVRLLLPELWEFVSEDQRQQFGVKYGRFVANADDRQAELAREILDAVDAVAYLPEEVRVAEIANAIDDLLLVHRGLNNFYNEPSRARLLESIVGDRPVPEAVRQTYVVGLVEAFLTNGHGVAWSAEPHYIEMIQRFGPKEAEIALISFSNRGVASQLQHPLSQAKFEELLDMIEPKLARRRYREIAKAVRESNAPLDKIIDDSTIKRLVKGLTSRD